MAPGVRLPPEIQLAQRLAGNEQVTRDRAVRKLRKYITARTQQAAGGFTHDELLKIWKGLFYCMWMQDKPLLQEELGRTISQLTHAFQTTEAQHLFLRAFWQTMIREWVGIDRLRLDKFYMLMRMVLSESLKALKTQGWEERQVEQLLELLTTEILNPDSQAPNGVKSHFLEIFLEELTKVGAAELTADQNLQFINPFCQIAAHTEDSLVLHSITRNIFETIVEQAPLAIEDLMNELDAQNGEEDVSDGDEESSEGEQEQDSARRRPPAGSMHGTDPEADGEQVQDDEDSAGPVLQFDYEAVANRLFELASGQSTPSQNRKRLYKVIRKLQGLAGGTFPEDDVPEKAYKKLLEGRREPKKKKKKKKRLLKLQPQNERGGGEAETSSPDPNPGIEKRSRRRPKRAGQRRVPKKRKPLPGARAEGTGVQ
ncbi:ribosomal RNA processing protein 1 homolog A isoform X1 [Nannospalax galili]|uniref:ribosomal RNA processing protein 1 homolog A isoform X1 n=1 Tax=Nannospalax galili TaxID=1026970 RepID=UPI0004ED3F1E|nr:ribosomal RNA processing protein 1 homolog A isoform X1 [Nannospalax galili]